MRLLCIISLLLSTSASAQWKPYELKQYSTELGLSDHRVTDVIQHPNGFVYVSTFNGLNRFDGYRFTKIPLSSRTYLEHHSAGEFVFGLFLIDDGRLLIQVDDEFADTLAFDLYDPSTGDIKAGSLPKSELIVGEKIEFEGESFTISPEPITAEDDLRFVDGKGNFFQRALAAGDSAYLKMNDGRVLDLTETWKSMTKVRPSPCGPGLEKYVYMRSYNGLLRLDIEPDLFTRIYADPENTWQYGKSARAAMQLQDSLFLLSLEDDVFVVWNRNTGKTESIRPEAPTDYYRGSHYARQFFELEDEIWYVDYFGKLGKLSRDLSQLEIATKAPKGLKTFPDAALTARGDFVVAASMLEATSELLLFHPSTQQWELLPGISAQLPEAIRFTALVQDLDNTFWVGSNKGMIHFNPYSDQILDWFGSVQAEVDTSGAQFAFVSSLTNDDVLALLPTEEGIWVGTEGGGILLMNRKGKVLREFTQDEGLPNNVVCSITPWEDGLWLGTYNGLCYLDCAEGPVRSFSTQNGMPHNECNRSSNLLCNDQTLVIGGMNGFMHFDPQHILSGAGSPRILLSSCSIYNTQKQSFEESVPLPGAQPRFTIPSGNRSCSFSFATDQHWRCESTEYFYRLVTDGTPENQTPWRSNGTNPTVEFEYLNAGNQNLQVRAIVADGSESQVTTVHLNVAEVFYKTGWFALIVFITAIGILFLIYRYRLQQAIRIERLRTRLSSDLHDDVGSVLSGVAYQMELLEMTVDEAHRPRVKQVAQSSRKAMWQMRDVVWAINSNHASAGDLELRMREFADEMLVPLSIQARFSIQNLDQNHSLPSETRHSLLLIYKEFVTNTIKHSNATEVQVLLKREGKRLILDLQDNGEGRSNPSASHTGQGLENMKQRAAKLGGTCSFNDESGFGVQVSVPL